jgi:hypothetical protein
VLKFLVKVTRGEVFFRTGTIIFQCIALLCIFTPALLAEGKEFLETGPGVFQSTSLREKIIVSYDDPGIFILSTVPTGIQEFNPADIEKELAKHIFIAFDPATNRYTELIAGEKRYRINGSFTVVMSRMRIAVDNLNPYLSISVENDQTIVGFRGLQTIVNAKGEVALTFLEANQLDSYSDLIVPYSLKKEGEKQFLLLKEQEVKAKSIGLSLKPPRNVCIDSPNTVFLTERDVARVKRIRNATDRLSFLERAFQRNQSNDPLAETLTLKITRDAIIHFNFNELSIKRVSPMKNRFGAKTVCVINNFSLNS